MQAIKTITQTKTLGFYKENCLWYADLPEFLELGLGTKSNLLMVDGSDTFLDLLSSNGTKLTVQLSNKPFDNHSIHLEKIKIGINQELLNSLGHAPVNYGAYYNVKKYQNLPYQHTLWLCPVQNMYFKANTHKTFI